MSYQIEWDAQGAICTYNDICTTSEVMEAIIEVGKHPAYPKFLFVMHDLSNHVYMGTGVAATIIVGASALVPVEQNYQIKTAIVSTDKSFLANFKSFRKYTQRDVEIFQSRSEAEHWVRQ